MSVRAIAANVAWTGSTLPAWRRFRAALEHPVSAQGDVLGRVLERNSRSSYGHDLAFDRLLEQSRRSADPVRELMDLYRARVPLRTYDEIEEYVQRIRAGEPNVLTSRIVRRLVPSSGSASGVKLLPFTVDLQRDFNRAIDPWIADLHIAHPAAVGGRSYWSISPAVACDCSSAVPVGFDDDSEYLGKTARALARTVLAVPGEVSRVADPDAFRYITLTFLCRARDLRIVSVWHPSFFIRMLDALPEWLPRMLVDIESGILRPPGRVHEDVLAALQRRMRPDPRRARDLRRTGSPDPRRLWPDLAVVSCWIDGPARAAAAQLRDLVPGARLQPKGLIATEGIVSIPFGGRHPLGVLSHFFEFIDEAGRSRLAHELQTGQEYTVVLTTSGGLYRYCLGDRVAVDGQIGATPSVRFVGKDDRISDHCGEKLSDGFVSRVLQRLFASGELPRFAMVAPVPVNGGLAYTLFVESESAPTDLAEHLERELRRNVHYAWCVDMRQLRPARAVRVGPDASRVYVDACVGRGQRLGNVKPAALECGTEWGRVFERAADRCEAVRH